MKKSISRLFYRIFNFLNFYSLRFYHFGKNSRIAPSTKMVNKKAISIGNNVQIAGNSLFFTRSKPGDKKPILHIGNYTCIGRMAYIVGVDSIKIGEHVLIAHGVTILDHHHKYEDVSLPVTIQGIDKIKEVSIGDGSWIGAYSCIFPGVKIGKHCIIGANTLVNKDIEDYSVVVGNPGEVIKRFDFKKNKWIQVKK